MSEQLRFEYVTCNLCGGDDTRLLYKVSPVRRNQKGEFDLVKCRKCGLVYTNPRPDSKSIAAYYDESYEYHETRNMTFLERLHYRYFRNPGLKKGKILDVGCGNGNYLYLFRKKGWDCYGTEVSSSMIDYMISDLGLKIFKGELYDITLPEEYFDVVTFWGSLEHMNNPFEVLTKTYRLLKPGARVIILVPNIESLEARIFRNYWHHIEVPTHYYQFSPETLTNLLKRAGFKIERVRFDPVSMGMIPSLGYALNKFGIKINLNKLAVKLTFVPLDILLSLFKSSGLMTIYATK